MEKEMMEYPCERCYKKFKPVGYDGAAFIGVGFGSYRGTYILCPECQVDFENWLRAKDND